MPSSIPAKPVSWAHLVGTNRHTQPHSRADEREEPYRDVEIHGDDATHCKYAVQGIGALCNG
jgi:hypothetical protein